MVVKEGTLKALAAFGLNQYEVKTYAALVVRGTSTAGEISDIAGIPYSRVYDVLGSLENMGFVISQIARPMKYRAVPPREALKAMNAKLKEDFEKKMSELRAAEKEVLNELEPLYETSKGLERPTEVFYAYRGRTNIHKKFEEMMNKAEHQVDIVLTGNGLLRFWNAHADLLRSTSARGITVRVVAPINQETSDVVKQVTNYGEVHSLTRPTASMILIDGKEALMVDTVPDDKSVTSGYDIGIWTQNMSMSKLIAHMFGSYWRKAETITPH